MIGLAALTSFAVCLAGVGLLLRSRRHWALDLPNDRSLHVAPTPRTGGIAIMLGVAGGTALVVSGVDQAPVAALGLAIVLSCISLADDCSGLPVVTRLMAHLLAAAVFAAYLTDSAAPWWWMLTTVLAMTAMTNFYNFMDGANGLAAGMAIFGFGAYGIAATQAAPGFAAVCIVIAASAAGFLPFNLAGRIFMGDAGSVPLGFLAAALGLQGWAMGLWPHWFPVLVFAPFVADAVSTLVSRIARRERFWEAHHDHHYQRLVRSGWSHARLAGAAYTLMVICSACSLTARAGDNALRTAAFATIAISLAVAGLAVELKWRRFRASQNTPP